MLHKVVDVLYMFYQELYHASEKKRDSTASLCVYAIWRMCNNSSTSYVIICCAFSALLFPVFFPLEEKFDPLLSSSLRGDNIMPQRHNAAP